MQFQQAPPALGNQYDHDRVLRSYLKRVLPEEVLTAIEDSLQGMGALAAGPLLDLQRAERGKEPILTQWDAWGNRIDRVETTPLWKEAERIAAETGLVSTAYEHLHGRYSRVHHFAKVFLFTPSSDGFASPLAMTDGTTRTLLASGNDTLMEQAVPHLASRNPEQFWTSGYWMTTLAKKEEDRGQETVARLNEDGTWRLYGRKWYTSDITTQVALVLARPEDLDDLALFYVKLRDDDGNLQNIQIHRLKDKLGTRKLPSAELTLDGTPAQLVGDLDDGLRQLAPMLNITRTWNAVSAVATMRRGLALARDYAQKRVDNGTPLSENPLHLDTMAGLQAEFEGAFHLTFRVIELIGRLEAGGLNDEQRTLVELLLNVLTSAMKLTTAKQAVTVTSEVLELFGGAGYMEDTGLPALLRDAQVLTIGEGTTNEVALDLLDALEQAGGMVILKAEQKRCAAAVREPSLVEAVERAQQALSFCAIWLRGAKDNPDALNAGARRFAITLGRSLELALLARHAQWSLDNEQDGRAAAAARRLAAGTDPMATIRPIDSYALANDTPLTADAEASADGAVEEIDLELLLPGE